MIELVLEYSFNFRRRGSFERLRRRNFRDVALAKKFDCPGINYSEPTSP